MTEVQAVLPVMGVTVVLDVKKEQRKQMATSRINYHNLYKESIALPQSITPIQLIN